MSVCVVWFDKRQARTVSVPSVSAYFYRGKQTQRETLIPTRLLELPQEAILALPHPDRYPILTGITVDKQAWAATSSRCSFDTRRFIACLD